MPLPTPNLDDLRFQRDLVDEARRRIIRYCPEWTEYNLSDPGITLIELFAWMTETIVYRLNRVPDKNYIKFIELLGLQLQPASSAGTELTFYLSTPFPIGPEDDTAALVPGATEVTTQRTEEEPEVIFTTDDKLLIRAPRLQQLRREADFQRNYLGRLGVEIFYTFTQNQPRSGETFYLGFDEQRDLSGHVLQLTFQCERTQAVGIRREDPPLVWECSLGNGQWQEVRPSARQGERDTTGGLNNPEGRLVLYMPIGFQADDVHGRRAYWLRCRLEQRRPEQGMYTESPRIANLQVHTVGAATRATHAVVVRDEALGLSNGESGQAFKTPHAPVLKLRKGETVEVEEARDGQVVFVPWQSVPDFAGSTRYDRHFHLDEATGEISFGPGVRQPDGTVRQYGRVPEAGRRIRLGGFRYGGGTAGNVPVGSLQVLRTAIPYIDRVTNLVRAEGGRDQETLEEAKMRAARELRAQRRAVTADDYENLAKQTSRAVARVKCRAPRVASDPLPPGMVEILVVPAAADALRYRDYSKLEVTTELRQAVEAHLNQYRLLTTTVRVREPLYLGVKARLQIVAEDYVAAEVVRARVIRSLEYFVCPLSVTGEDTPPVPLPINDGEWEGWPFGRNLYTAEIYSLVQQVPGVKHVLEVHLSQRPVVPAKESPSTATEEESESEERRLTPVSGRMIEVSDDTLLCSLNHEVEIVEV